MIVPNDAAMTPRTRLRVPCPADRHDGILAVGGRSASRSTHHRQARRAARTPNPEIARSSAGSAAQPTVSMTIVIVSDWPWPSTRRPASSPCACEVDRVGRLGVRLDRDHVAVAGRGEDDQLAEVAVEAQPELRLQGQVDQPADAPVALEGQAGQHVVELQALHAAGPCGSRAGRRPSDARRSAGILEDPVLRGGQDHPGLLRVAAGREREPEVGVDAEPVGQVLGGRVGHRDRHRQAAAGEAVADLEDGVGRPVRPHLGRVPARSGTGR